MDFWCKQKSGRAVVHSAGMEHGEGLQFAKMPEGKTHLCLLWLK